MIDTDTTLPLCMIPVKGIMWGICRYSLERNYIMFIIIIIIIIHFFPSFCFRTV